MSTSYLAGWTDAAGNWSHSLNLPPLVTLAGMGVTAQTVTLGGGPFLGPAN